MSMKTKKSAIKKESAAAAGTPGVKAPHVKTGSMLKKTKEPVAASTGLSLGILLNRTRAFFRPAEKAEV